MYEPKIDDLVPFDRKIERTSKRNKKEKKQVMAQNLGNEEGQAL